MAERPNQFDLETTFFGKRSFLITLDIKYGKYYLLENMRRMSYCFAILLRPFEQLRLTVNEKCWNFIRFQSSERYIQGI